MSKPLLEPHKFKNCLIGKSFKDLHTSDEESKTPNSFDEENKLSTSPKESGICLDKGNDFHMVEANGLIVTKERTGSFSNCNGQEIEKNLSKFGKSFAPKADKSRSIVSSFGELETGDFENDPIFHQLCPTKQYSGDACLVCKTEFGFFQKRHRNCHFCGKACCDDHSKRRRPDPQKPDNYARICDICHKKYVHKATLDEFKEKLKRREDELQALEKKFDMHLETLKKKQNMYDNQMAERHRKDQEIKEKIDGFNEKTQKNNEEIKKVEKECMALSAEYAALQAQSTEFGKKIEDLRLEEEKMQKENEKLSAQLAATDQDISQISKIIANYDLTIENNKLYRATNSSKIKGTSINANPEPGSMIQMRMSQKGSRQSGAKSSLIDMRKTAYLKNQEPDKSACIDTCSIF